MKFTRYIIAVLGLIFMVSCTELVDVDLPQAPERLVIEGSIDWEKGTKGNVQFVKLSLSTPYFAKESNVPVKNAKVTISKLNTGDVIDMINVGGGVYATNNFLPELQAEYMLKVVYDGKTYQATEKMIEVPKVLRFTQKKEPFFTGETVKVSLIFKDFPKQDNYYFSFLKNKETPRILLRSDRYNDGLNLSINYRNDELKKGDVLNYRFYGISKFYYNYLRVLSGQISDANGSPFSVPPVKVTGNCKNLEDPKEEVLGYFRLSQFKKLTYTVKDLDVDTTKKNKQ